jgi:hypothetical protein
MTLGTAVCAYLSIILTSNPELPSSQPLTAAQVLATCDTGDLLFFTNKTSTTWFKAANPITHISVIVRDASGRPLSVETHADVDGPPNYKGDGINDRPARPRQPRGCITCITAGLACSVCVQVHIHPRRGRVSRDFWRVRRI